MRRTQTKCQSCGKVISLSGLKSRRCPECGADLPRAFTYTASQRDFSPHPNRTPLRPGMKARFHGREYTLIGRCVLSMEEEGQRYYWDEWELVSEEGNILYLEFDEGKWKLSEPYYPARTMSPVEAQTVLRVGAQLPVDSGKAMVTEVAEKRIEFLQGELTYEANVGDTAFYADATLMNRLFAVEWTRDEVEYYQGKPLTEREVLTAFDLKDAIKALDNRTKVGRSQMVFAGVCILLSIVSFVYYGIALGSGKTVQRNSAPIDSIGPDGMRFGPVTLDPAQRLYRLAIRGSMTEASAWVAGVLETAEGAELIGSQGDFWDESGRDEDGYWHESDLHAQTDFSARNPGPYYIHLYSEKDTSIGTFGAAEYELKAGVMYPMYFLTFGIIAILIGFLFFIIGASKSAGNITASS